MHIRKEDRKIQMPNRPRPKQMTTILASFTAFLTSLDEYFLQECPSRQPVALVLVSPSAFRELYGVEANRVFTFGP